RANKAHPPEASTKELVEILLIIGVMSNKSNPYPRSKPLAPAIKNILIFLSGLLSDIRILPHMAPHTVWAAVGMQLMATHPPLFIFPIRIISIQDPKFSPLIKGSPGA